MQYKLNMSVVEGYMSNLHYELFIENKWIRLFGLGI